MSPSPPNKLLGGVLILLAIGVLCGLGPLVIAAWNGYRSVRAADWPIATGEVRKLELVSGRHMTESVRVEYAYEVAGTKYSGTRVAFGYLASNATSSHAKLYEKLKAARSIGVRYNPADPADACLACGWHHSHQFTTLFGAIWIVWIGGFIWMARLDSSGDAPLLRNLVTYWKPSSSGDKSPSSTGEPAGG